MGKWSNIRDSFLRSLRTKSGDGAKRSYIYSEHLQFLLKIAQKDLTESNYSQATTDNGISQETTEVEKGTGSHLSTASSTPSTSGSTLNEHRPKAKKKATR